MEKAERVVERKMANFSLAVRCQGERGGGHQKGHTELLSPPLLFSYRRSRSWGGQTQQRRRNVFKIGGADFVKLLTGGGGVQSLTTGGGGSPLLAQKIRYR